MTHLLQTNTTNKKLIISLTHVSRVTSATTKDEKERTSYFPLSS